MGGKPKKPMDLDKIRRQTAERVRRHRARHRDELLVAHEGRRPMHYVADVVDEDGVVVDVVVYMGSPGPRMSHAWTPRVPMAFETAMRLRAFRRSQVAFWRGIA